MSGETILIEQLRADVERLRDDRADLQERCNRLTGERNAAINMVASADSEWKARAEKAERELAISTTEIDSLRGKLAMLSAQARNAERERDEAIARDLHTLDLYNAAVRERDAAERERDEARVKAEKYREQCDYWREGRDEARAERDARPDISPEDARMMEDARATLELPAYEHGPEHQDAAIRIASALRAHAAKARPVCTCSRRLGDYCPTPDPDCAVHSTEAVKP